MRGGYLSTDNNRLLDAARELFARRYYCDDSRSGEQVPDTRTRILTAARAVFADKGRDATVREICAAAGVNGAAINYHFGSKEGMLAEVLKEVLDESMVRYPLDGGAKETDAPDVRLFKFVLAFLCRILDESCYETEGGLGRLLSEAFYTPLGSFARYAMAHREEVKATLHPIMESIAGRTLPDTLVVQMGRQVVAQILMFDSHRDLIADEGENSSFDRERLSSLAHQITLFAIGGIKHYLENYDAE